MERTKKTLNKIHTSKWKHIIITKENAPSESSVQKGIIWLIKKHPHFRFLKYKEGPPNKKRKHPKLILEKENDTYHYMGMTESAKRGRHKNIELTRNPKRGDTRPAYIRKEYLIRSTKDFHGIRKDYSMSSADKSRVLFEAQKLKAKKKK